MINSVMERGMKPRMTCQISFQVPRTLNAHVMDKVSEHDVSKSTLLRYLITLGLKHLDAELAKANA